MFIFINIMTRRDFGPMLKAGAEQRARTTGEIIAKDARPLLRENSDRLDPPEGTPYRWINAAAPLATVMLGVLGGILYVGASRLMRDGIQPDFFSPPAPARSLASPCMILVSRTEGQACH